MPCRDEAIIGKLCAMLLDYPARCRVAFLDFFQEHTSQFPQVSGRPFTIAPGKQVKHVFNVRQTKDLGTS